MSFDGKKLNSIYNCVAAHPFLCTLFVCLILTPFCFGAENNIQGSTVFLAFIVFSAFVLISFYKQYLHGKIDKTVAILISFAFILFSVSAIDFLNKRENKAVWIFSFGIVLLVLFIRFVKVDTSMVEKVNCFFIISTGFMMRFFYILVTSVYTRQNDVHSFGGDSGHAAYIEYFLYNRQLPDFDVRERWQFYHPPLHHIICAEWIDFLENICGIDHNYARESLQMLTLFYSMACIIIVYKILRHFKLKGVALYVPLAIFAFHPSFIILSGSINNDMLSITFILASVLNTLKWHENPTTKNILKIALTVGLGMMTKLSVALVAPPIALLFVMVLIKNRKNLFEIIKQYVFFGLVCVPLGLWWGVRNFIKFKVPITFVPKLEENSTQYVGHIPFVERLFDFSPKQFSSVFEQWDRNGGYSEYNPTIAFLKNSLFGESINKDDFGDKLLLIPSLFFWIGALLAVLSFVIMIYCFVKKNSNLKWTIKVFLGSFYALLMINFYKFCADFPHTCTQNFRYISPLLALGVLFIGIFISNSNKKDKVYLNVISRVVIILSVTFCILSFVTYFLILSPINK